MAKRVRYVPVARPRLSAEPSLVRAAAPRLRTIDERLSRRPSRRDERVKVLTAEGLTKWEAREFQKLSFDDPGLRVLLRARRQLLSRVGKNAKELEWSEGKHRYERSRAIREYYKHRRSTVRTGPDAGKPSPWELRRKAIGFAGFNPRTFTNRGSGKQGKKNDGNVRRQRRLRKQVLRLENHEAKAAEGRVDNATLQGWIATLSGNIKLATDRNRRRELQQGRSRLRRVLRKQGG